MALTRCLCYACLDALVALLAGPQGRRKGGPPIRHDSRAARDVQGAFGAAHVQEQCVHNALTHVAHGRRAACMPHQARTLCFY